MKAKKGLSSIANNKQTLNVIYLQEICLSSNGIQTLIFN